MSRIPSMSRAHFQFVADILADQRAHHEDNDSPAMAEAVAMIAHQFARELKATNPRFDRARFIAACGVGE
jgi:hypothetical protein